jgi:hypothetical protein
MDRQRRARQLNPSPGTGPTAVGVNPMIKLMILLKKRADLTVDQFRHHYETSHARHAMRHFGHLWVEYRRNYPVSSSSFAAVDEGADVDPALDAVPDFDAVTEIVLRDQPAFDEFLRLLAVPETRRLFSEDEARFTDRKRSKFMVCDVVQSQAWIQWPETPASA